MSPSCPLSTPYSQGVLLFLALSGVQGHTYLNLLLIISAKNISIQTSTVKFL